MQYGPPNEFGPIDTDPRIQRALLERLRKLTPEQRMSKIRVYRALMDYIRQSLKNGPN